VSQQKQVQISCVAQFYAESAIKLPGAAVAIILNMRFRMSKLKIDADVTRKTQQF
jgi:hypothetical protein